MTKSEILLQSLTEFFDDEENLKKLSDILTHRSGISLRNLEWFITIYAKSNNLVYRTSKGNFPVHVAYKSSLVGYSKKLFDPFCRTERVDFKGLTTTVAQLNFIRWCIKNDIIEYMIKEKPKLQTHQKTELCCTRSGTC
jgi:hypothetical protein